jgi:hypothetical protein
VNIDHLNVTQMMHFDHDTIQVQMKQFSVVDHTNYPRTIDPQTVGIEDREEIKIQEEIMGRKDLEN